VTAHGESDKIPQTPTISAAAAYADGDALGGLLTFANAAGWTGGTGRLIDVEIIDNDNECAAIDLVLFNQTFTAAADNAEFDPSDADMQNCIGHVSIADTDYASFANNAVATVRDIWLEVESTTTSIFGQMVIREVKTYTAVDDITVQMGLSKD